ncbi:MAG: type transport system ATP-binding protein [Chloroflexota bacterium]|jgi:ABC-2 type transport system ATP-binding protein|nr:type transport system ATP-binding protein [Chloroflexota bacterium]
MRSAPATAVDVVDLGKDYGGRPVLAGVSFDVRAGEIFALLGANGAGKTTTVEILEGYRRADRGRVRVLGADPAHATRGHRARVGLMLQGGGGIDPRMTAREVVALHGRFHAEPRNTDELLALVGLVGVTARTRYRRLSGGEKQRVGLAVALVGRPDVAILDEPTAGMDVEARATTRDLLGGLRDAGVAVVLTSHDLADVERMADRIAILDRGRIVAQGSADELTSASAFLRFRLASALTASDRVALGADLGALARAAGAGGRSVTVDQDGAALRYRVAGVDPTPVAISRLATWCAARDIVILELRSDGGTLEERYLELTTRPSVDDLPDRADEQVR